MLAKYHPMWLNIHVNHANEITPELARACDKLSRAGIPLGNQSVLLAGVNDCVNIQRELVHGLVEMRVRPYYLYQCDLVEGSGHFRTPVGKGLEIIEGLRGHTSGYAVPTFVVDAPGGGGKIPVMPNYLDLVLGPQGRAPQLRGVHHHVRGAARVQAARQGELRVVPAPAPGAGPGRCPRAPPGRADVDRAGRVRAGPRARHDRGPPAQGPRNGSRTAWARSRARRCDRGLPVLEAGRSPRTAASPDYGPGEEPRRPRARRPRRRTTSCSSTGPACGHTAIRYSFDGPRAVKRGHRHR